jgi:hypothetical protein
MLYATAENDCFSLGWQRFTSSGRNRDAYLFSRRRDFTVPFSKRFGKVL